MHSRRQSAFTLIELMIVLAIISISAALAIGAMAGNQPRTRLVAAISDVRIEMLRARTEAMKSQKYAKLCFWNDATPFDANPAGLMVRLECRVAGGAGCVQERDVCQGSAAAPTFKANTVDPNSNVVNAAGVCLANFWCLKSGVSFGATAPFTLSGMPIEARGSEKVSINRFWTGAVSAPGAQGTAAILETTFDSRASVNDLRSTATALSGAVEMTNSDQCLSATGSRVPAGGTCVNFQNRIRASYTFGGAVRIQE